jgi:F-type H+-transporting ATPase subunit b
MLATSINLTPDLSLIPMLVIFIIVLAVLNIFIFRPAMRLIDARKALTEGQLERAKELELSADASNQHMQDELETVRQNGMEERKKKREKAQAKADRIQDRAERETQEITVRGSEERERMREKFEKDIESRIPEISRMIKEHAMLSDEEEG